MQKLCKKCGCHENEHAINCADIPKEQLRDAIDSIQKQLDFFFAQGRRMNKQIVFWQGKYSMVKQENNKLRKKLYYSKKII